MMKMTMKGAANMAGDVLRFDDLVLEYVTGGIARRAARQVSLRVREGEAIGIVGESGSGKSTLARAALGLLPANVGFVRSGSIRLGGVEAASFTDRQWEGLRGNPVAMVFQDPLSYLNPIMRIGAQIGESVRLHDPAQVVAARTGELLDLVRLPRTVARAYPHELSGGMRQRALLAVALGCRPRLLVADEPTTALDVTTQAEILLLLRELRQELGMALLIISHDLGVIAAECDRIYVMYAGTVVEWGRSAELFAEPAHPYTLGLLQAARAEKDARGFFETIPGNVPDLTALGPGCPFESRCGWTQPRCATEMPPPTPLDDGDGDRSVRCWAVADLLQALPRQGGAAC